MEPPQLAAPVPRHPPAALRGTEAALQAARKKYKNFQTQHKDRFGVEFSGKLLDFGCGAGAFVMASAMAGVDSHGIEVAPGRHKQFLSHARQMGFSQTDRFSLYDGRLMPYASNSFDGCYSWFVFEHVREPQVSLREISRVLKPGGTLSLHADDAWDGHVAQPWPPYLPREFAAAYLEGLGIPERQRSLRDEMVYISAPVICDILTTFGMEIIHSNTPVERTPLREALYVTSQAEARALGMKLRTQQGASPVENLRVFARKR